MDLHLGYDLYTDQFYTSSMLAEELLHLGTTLTGTVMYSRKKHACSNQNKQKKRRCSHVSLPRLLCTGWVSNVNSSTMAPSSRAGPPRHQVGLSVTGVGEAQCLWLSLQGVGLSFLQKERSPSKGVPAEEQIPDRADECRDCRGDCA